VCVCVCVCVHMQKYRGTNGKAPQSNYAKGLREGYAGGGQALDIGEVHPLDKCLLSATEVLDFHWEVK
jgi:hypothetical protein